MSKRRARMAILPRNRKDPTGVDRLERGAMREAARRIAKLKQEARALLESLPAQEIAANKRYQFLIDPQQLQTMLDSFGDFVDLLMIGREDGGWLFADFAAVAYQRGTGQEFANLAQQSQIYEAASGDLRQVLMSDVYRRRLGLTQARVFEEMKGLSADTKLEMGRVIADGIGRGQGPMEISKRINERLGVIQSRANRIARTEVGQALRRARWEESQDASERYNLQTKLLHLSAFAQTSRPSHMDRNGKMYTKAETEEWYSVDANSINCLCSQVAVLVDNDGNPVSEAMQAKISQERKRELK